MATPTSILPPLVDPPKIPSGPPTAAGLAAVVAAYREHNDGIAAKYPAEASEQLLRDHLVDARRQIARKNPLGALAAVAGALDELTLRVAMLRVTP